MVDAGVPHRQGGGPRPLDFIRVRLYRGGQAEYVAELFEGAEAFWFKQLGKLRDEGFDENSDEVQRARERLLWLISALKDVKSGMVELAGTGEHR
jgi:hypothetical protein